MNEKEFNEIVEKAKSDPEFFHDLVFNPETAVSKLSFLDRKTKRSIIGTTPEAVVGTIVDEMAGCGSVTISCGDTCTVTILKNPFESQIQRFRRF